MAVGLGNYKSISDGTIAVEQVDEVILYSDRRYQCNQQGQAINGDDDYVHKYSSMRRGVFTGPGPLPNDSCLERPEYATTNHKTKLRMIYSDKQQIYDYR
jgi:hypothetical protein